MACRRQQLVIRSRAEEALSRCSPTDGELAFCPIIDLSVRPTMRARATGRLVTPGRDVYARVADGEKKRSPDEPSAFQQPSGGIQIYYKHNDNNLGSSRLSRVWAFRRLKSQAVGR